jgi:hypothetical protein
MQIALGECCNRHFAEYGTLAGVRGLVKPGNRLRWLCLSKQAYLGDEVALLLGEHCPQLEVFSCPRRTTDVGIAAVDQKCPNLIELNLSSCQVTDQGLTTVAQQCKKLQYLALVGCARITSVGVAFDAKHLLVDTRYLARARGCSH